MDSSETIKRILIGKWVDIKHSNHSLNFTHDSLVKITGKDTIGRYYHIRVGNWNDDYRFYLVEEYGMPTTKTEQGLLVGGIMFDTEVGVKIDSSYLYYGNKTIFKRIH